MRFAVGYQLAEPGEESFVEIVREHRNHVAEVYFAWVGHASGRSPVGARGGKVGHAARQRLEADLAGLRDMGIALDLLLNANCYGGRAISRALEHEVVGLLEHLGEVAGGVETVTTTSPAVAHVIKRHFRNIDVRASVNMRIGTVAGMRYLADVFDSYYVQRDCNRDLERLAELRAWADANGKKLCMLVNSGCLRFCSGQTFHDNLVAHETEVDETRNLAGFSPMVCRRLLRDRTNWPEVLRATWTRPEDLRHYEGLFDVFKLATRMHERPQAVIRAYAAARFAGNLLDLFEPGYSPAFAPWVLDNTRFPDGWFEHVTRHARQAHDDPYYARVLEQVLVELPWPARPAAPACATPSSSTPS